jgi:hypothetical protein
MEHKSGLCRLAAGLEIPDMEWDECPSCGELAIDPENSARASKFLNRRGKVLQLA